MLKSLEAPPLTWLTWGGFLTTAREQGTMERLGRVAQLVRAPRLHRGGPRFEPVRAHHFPHRFGLEDFEKFKVAL